MTRRRVVVSALTALVVLGLLGAWLGLRQSQGGPPDDAALPADTVYVATTGHDDSRGTLDDPVGNVWAAYQKVRPGGTIAIKGGVWHDTVTLEGKNDVTIRSVPGEQVWFDGASELEGFAPAEGHWRLDDYTVTFDTSPTYERGAKDNETAGWSFIDPAHPLAADPHQVWVDGVAQAQVASPAELAPGSFCVDPATHSLWLGSDPTGKRVVASDLQVAMRLQAPGLSVRGIGFRHYAPSVPDFGTIVLAGERTTLTDVTVQDSATTGVSVQSDQSHLTRVHITGSGMLGLHADHADALVLDDLLVRDNNREHFNPSPSAGGAKITKTINLQVHGGDYSGNAGTGLWLDESDAFARLVGVAAAGNARYGIHLEISTRIAVVNCVVVRNTDGGLVVQNTDQVQIWGNTLQDNQRNLDILQDDRSPAGSPGSVRDDLPAHMTWVTKDITVVDNILSGGTDDADTLLRVQDLTQKRAGTDFAVTLRTNLYLRPQANHPDWTHVWAAVGPTPQAFPDLPAFQAATGQDTGSLETSGVPEADSTKPLVTPLPGELHDWVGTDVTRIGSPRSATDATGFAERTSEGPSTTGRP